MTAKELYDALVGCFTKAYGEDATTGTVVLNVWSQDMLLVRNSNPTYTIVALGLFHQEHPEYQIIGKLVKGTCSDICFRIRTRKSLGR